LSSAEPTLPIDWTTPRRAHAVSKVAAVYSLGSIDRRNTGWLERR